MTVETPVSGGSVYYMHDRPTLAESSSVWKMSADAIGMSTDGGRTYSTGLTVTGEAILNRIYAVGIDADYITAGRISSKSGNAHWDLDTGNLVLDRGVIYGANGSQWNLGTGEMVLLGKRAGVTVGANDGTTMTFDGNGLSGVTRYRNVFNLVGGTVVNGEIQPGTWHDGIQDAELRIGDVDGGFIRVLAYGESTPKHGVASVKAQGQFLILADTSTSRQEMGTTAMRVGVPNGHASNSKNMVVIAGDPLVFEGTAGTTSDRRYKEHIAYVGDEADAFVRSLRPATFVKDGRKQAGFYAQDVEEACKEGWPASPVSEVGDGSESRLILDYQALIAPLVAYCQHLEKRIEQLERTSKSDKE
jgi:hypothetical protein